MGKYNEQKIEEYRKNVTDKYVFEVLNKLLKRGKKDEQKTNNIRLQ